MLSSGKGASAGDQTDGLIRNLSLYLHYEFFFCSFFWLPVFFLYFNSKMPLASVLRLEAVYYAAVVLIEVPSGWFSDTFGRRLTLIVSTVALTLGYLLFFFGDNFATFAFAQVFLGVGFGFNSGTNVSFHFDSLKALNREAEFGARESRANQIRFYSRAVTVLIGGVAGTWHLGLAYLLSALTTIGALIAAWHFTEPPREADEGDKRTGFLPQLAQCSRYLGRDDLRWVFVYVVTATVLGHVPYEFYQSYVQLLGSDLFGGIPTTLGTGIVAALTAIFGSVAAGLSPRVARSLGIYRTLLMTTTMHLVIIGAMALVLNPLILALIMMRNVPDLLADAPISGHIAPRVKRRHRATYLSLQSLAGRLAFSCGLISLSWLGSDTTVADWPGLRRMLVASLLAGFLALAYLFRSRAPAGVTVGSMPG